ncbi:MAG: hypothetical protein JSV65_02865 [Armatimonadota bacterium]|nr:MAG: hypothetical protein JSV65_02865 [Armatimonadota bacterium]
MRVRAAGRSWLKHRPEAAYGVGAVALELIVGEYEGALDSYLCGTALFPAARIGPDAFDPWGWRVRQTPMERDDVDAMAWVYSSGQRGTTAATLDIHTGADASDRPRWQWIGANALRMSLLEAAAEEIIHRCDLTGPFERRRPLGLTVMWQRSAVADIPPLSRWL